jgi:hypothetical protein
MVGMPTLAIMYVAVHTGVTKLIYNFCKFNVNSIMHSLDL